MELYYTPTITEGTFELPEEERRHAIQVLRHRVGDELLLVDGKGGWYRGAIVQVGKRQCQLEVTLMKRETVRSGYTLRLAVAPTKRNERFEWFLEKATEIGIDEIIPLLTRRSERRQIRTDRYEKVLVAAMKQSRQAWLPRLEALTDWGTFLERTADCPQRCIAWIDESVNATLADTYPHPSDVLIMIGPEGGFSPEEAEQARAAGVRPVSLGPNRLRTETAALVAVQSVRLLHHLHNRHKHV